MMGKTKVTSDGLAILHRRYYANDPGREESLQAEIRNLQIAEKLYELRTQHRLTQKQLAKKSGLKESVISRLEGASYTGHSFKTLQAIAGSLGYAVNVQFVPTSTAGLDVISAGRSDRNKLRTRGLARTARRQD
jgi:transcriptional regulator with XRE-family HTH domain